MTANELRIGNYYAIAENSGIEYRKVIELVLYQDEYFSSEVNLNQAAKPIPLTEKWLLKLGFVKTRDEASPYMDGEHTVISGRFTVFSKIPLTFNSVHGWFLNKHQTELTIKYVHQLQNLYWCLCGEELKINL